MMMTWWWFFQCGQKRMYPHKILDWHEIVNDTKVTVSYCPLTGSAIGLNPVIKNGNSQSKTTFGVSGKLYNTNLILYDRFSDSYWSQMTNQCVAGPLKGIFPENEILVETSFKTAKAMFPDALVLSNNTGIYNASQYAFYPYGNYKEDNDQLLFPVNNEDNRVPNKERVMGVVINGMTLVVRFENTYAGINVINTELAADSIVVVWDSGKNYSVAYRRNLSNSSVPLNFSANQDNGAAIFTDNLQNQYNILGEVISGPNSGQRLEGTHSYIAFWFAWAAFYPDLQIYGN